MLAPYHLQDVAFAPDGTLRDAAIRIGRLLAEAGIATPQQDARFLLQGVLGTDAAAMIRDADASLGDRAAALTDAVRRRIVREPLSRILGWREFYGRRFIVTPDVLDPRAETETLVDLGLELAKSRDCADRPISIADIGTGSGALIATLLAELPGAHGLASDISAAALTVARANAEAIGVADRLTLVEISVLHRIETTFDIVVSNPPYIPTADIVELDPEVREHDPLLALDGGRDGLAIYRKIASHFARVVGAPHIVVEVGGGLAQAVVDIFEKSGFSLICARNDLGGHVRAVAFTLRP